MSNVEIPMYWEQTGSNAVGVEYSCELAESALATGYINVISEQQFKQRLTEGYTNCMPWILQRSVRENCFKQLEECALKLEFVKSAFQNPGVDIKESYAGIQSQVGEINNTLYNVLTLASTNAVQEVPEDL